MAESVGAAGSAALQERPVEDLPAGVVVDSSALPLLDDVARRLIRDLIPLLERNARDQQVTADRVGIRGYTSWEEGERELIITQYVDLPLEESLAYWDTLETPLEDWRATLSPEDDEVACRLIRIQVTETR